MMGYFFSLILGYVLGSLSPSAWISKKKKKDLRKHGTGNLGATNTMLVFGKRAGLFVMVFDILKSCAAVCIAQRLFPEIDVAGLLAGAAAVIGHIFPFYMKFKGGKGLASYAGMIVALDPIIFAAVLFWAVMAMLLFNYTVAVPLSAAALFPVLYGYKTKKLSVVLITLSVSIILCISHISSIKRIRAGGDVKIREFLKDKFLK